MAIGQQHFYCSPSRSKSCWLISEKRNKRLGICGGVVYSAPSRYFAYQFSRVLNLLYRKGRFDYLARLRSVCSYSPVSVEQCKFDIQLAEDLIKGL